MGGGEKLFSEDIIFPAICFFIFLFISLALTSHFGNYAPRFFYPSFLSYFFFYFPPAPGRRDASF